MVVDKNIPVVYFTPDISARSLVMLYESLNPLMPNKIAVKISTGESEYSNHLRPELIASLVKSVKGTLVECNTAYEGNRHNNEVHWKTIKERGYIDIAPFDLMDEEGEIEIPVKNGLHLNKAIVGSHIQNYGSMIVLSHAKGHPMAGFGGCLKNLGIGCSSPHGKAYIHSGGRNTKTEDVWQDNYHADFVESIADACKGIIDIFHGNLIYINVANNLSVDCDCVAQPAAPSIPDIGIFASTDPVAVDQAVIDAIYKVEHKDRGDLIEQFRAKTANMTIDAGYYLDLGKPYYHLKTI